MLEMPVAVTRSDVMGFFDPATFTVKGTAVMGATSFTPVAALSGGVLIGLAAVLLMLLLGRILGISGIVGGLFSPGGSSDLAWRAAFVVGCLVAPAALLVLSVELPAIHAPSSNLIYMAVAGLLVGFGAALGSGCTSGHGVCGLSRLSRRSLIAVAIFMTAAFVTVAVTRHVL